MSQDELKLKRAVAYGRMRSSHSLLIRVHQLCESLEARYNSDKSDYERVDRELAMLDGRFQLVPEAAKKDRKRSTPELTVEQILEIAQQLGIRVADEEPEVHVAGEED